MSKKDDEKYNNVPDDELFVNNQPDDIPDDSDSDEFYYEPVEAEIYQMDPDGEEPPWYMAQKQRRLTPEELAEKKKKETEEVLAFVNGETDELLTDEEKERAEAEKKIVDFRAAADKKSAEEKNQDGRIKNFIKSHVHDIIAYGIGVLIIVIAILAALKFRRYQEGIEAERAAHMPPPPTPMVVATADDAEKATDGNAGKATPDDAKKATDGNAEKSGKKKKKKKTEKASPETAVTEFPETVPGGIVQPKNN